MRKKLVALLLALAACFGLALGFSSCGEEEKPTNSTVSENPLQSSEESNESSSEGGDNEDSSGGGEDSEKEEVKETEGLEYTLSENEKYYIVSGIGSATATDVVIPSTYKKLPVQEIGGYVFYNCRSLTSVVIPDSVTTIGNNAFRYCSNLKNVEIGDGVTTIGGAAFRSCDSLTSVEIPDSVTTIEDSAFV